MKTSSLTKSVLVLRERNWYYHDNPARENLFILIFPKSFQTKKKLRLIRPNWTVMKVELSESFCWSMANTTRFPSSRCEFFFCCCCCCCCCCLRGAWRDHRFPEPFSWFLHETGLESLKNTSARCFLLKCQRKVSKKAKEHRQFRGVLGRWRTAAIDRTTFHTCQRCRKTAVLAVFSRL